MREWKAQNKKSYLRRVETRKHTPDKAIFWTDTLLLKLDRHKVCLRFRAASPPKTSAFQLQSSLKTEKFRPGKMKSAGNTCLYF